MKKRLLSLALVLALCLGLAVTAWAAEEPVPETEEGMPEVMKFGMPEGMFLRTIAEYPLNEPAAGDGWKYDGNYTLTLMGLQEDKMYLDVLVNCNQQFHIVLADGTENRLYTLRIHQNQKTYEILLENGELKFGKQNGWDVLPGHLTISGGGALTITGNSASGIIFAARLTMNGGTLCVPNAFFEVISLTMNSGTIECGSLLIREYSYYIDEAMNYWKLCPLEFNGGTIILDRREIAERLRQSYLEQGYDPAGTQFDDNYCSLTVEGLRNHAYPNQEESFVAGLEGKFVGEDGRPLTLRHGRNDINKSKWFLYTADGLPAAYAKFSKESSVPVGGFTDVKTSDYFADPVLWAVEQGITTGTSATLFSPDTTCTQGQILTFLWRAKGEPAPKGTVSSSQYYAKAAQWAKEQGLTDDFSANAPCTRAMVVGYLWKLAGSPKASAAAQFADVPAGLTDAVSWAAEQGITTGTSAATFSPNDTCTRGQIVTFLHRAYSK